MNVLSLFDGMSCGRIALERLGIKVDNYFASEIDPYAIKIAQKNYPDTQQLGDIRNHASWKLPKIDIAIAGSPCQDLTRIKSKDGKGLMGDKSKLYFEFYKTLKMVNPENFFLENVMMNKESEGIITSMLETNPHLISSERFSAQDRPRLYWTSLDVEELPTCDLVTKDVLQPESEIDEKYYYEDEIENYNPDKRVIGTLNRYYENGKVKFTETTSRVYNPNFKMATLTAVSGGHQEKKVMVNGRVRKLTPLEYERMQTVPDGYTEGVSNSQRYKMLGNGWTVDTIAHILKGLK